VDLSSVHSSVESFEGKPILLVVREVSTSILDGKKFYKFTDDRASFRALGPQWMAESVGKKVLEQRFVVGRIRRVSSEEKVLVQEDFVIEIDDPSALAIQEATGFETGKQEVLETFLQKD
jgi:hypothetical protein